MAAGYVYVIDPHIRINNKPVVKIGMTTRSPIKRLKEIQTSIPQKATLVHATRFPNAKAAEKILHQRLALHRVMENGGTEFYFIDPHDAVQLVNQLAYQISAMEAKAALEREVESFSRRISNDLSGRIMKFSLVFVYAGIFVYYSIEKESLASGLGAVLLATIYQVWLLVCIAAQCAGDALVQRIWRKKIRQERVRLLEKYPAARLME